MIAVALILGWRLVFPGPVSVVTNAKQRPSDPVPTQLISLDDAFSKGSPSAAVTIVEYGDLQCPACAKFVNSTYRPLMKDYVDAGRVRFMFKHFPLPNHEFARPAAIAAQCAGQQNQFWQFYEAAYAPESKLSELFFKKTATALKLNVGSWSACRMNSSTAEFVQTHQDEAQELKLRATPAFLVGRMVEPARFKATSILYGARSLDDFSDAIALATQTKK
jgi:protein-disulfide isomerase